MLRALRIRNLVTIEDLSVDFGAGFSVLTGETGAGKSILVDAVGLAAGDRADPAMVRAGADRAVVEAVFEPSSRSVLRSILEPRGLEDDDGALLVRRDVPSSGSGRVFVNGSPTTLAVLREVGDFLVELHGQHEHQSLLSPDRHQELLDAFGECGDAADAVSESVDAARRAEARLAELAETARESVRRTERLRAEIEEIDAVSPRPGEADDLARERRVLQNSERVARLLDEAFELLYDGDASAAAQAAAAARRAEELAEVDPTLADVAARLESARLELQDAGATLRDYRDRADFDPARLESIESRRVQIERLFLRYGADEAAVLAHRDAAIAELDTISHVDREISAARDAVETARAAYRRAAAELSARRRAAGRRLAPAVEAQLNALALGKARFEVELTPARGAVLETPGGEPLPFHTRGAERVEFLLAPNPGEPPRALQRAASGGELSRVMLALHLVLEGTGRGRVLVFDEVDAGVGGAVAAAVGSRLAELGRRHQVLCVTHLPQVAAHADRHYHVRKRVAGGRTLTEVIPLEGEDRVNELARMLGGKQVTPASRRNAVELLAEASGGSRARARRAE